MSADYPTQRRIYRQGLEFELGADKVEVPLDQRHIVCPVHAEPFRATWPLGWPKFAMSVAEQALGSPALQAGLKDPRFWRSNLYWEDLPRRRSPNEVRTLLESRPACEWIQRNDLYRTYMACGLGSAGVCARCGLVDRVVRYGFADGRVIPSVCLRCVVAGNL